MRLLPFLLLIALPLLSQPLGPEIPVSAVEYGALAEGSRPRVASNGEDFFAVWNDDRGSWGARFSSEGELLDPLGIDLGKAFVRGVIWSGRYYLVIRTDAVLAFDADGTLRGEHLLLPYLPADTMEVHLATNGANVLGVTRGGAVRLDLDGRPFGSALVAPNAFLENAVDVASNGRDYAIVYANQQGVFLQRVGGDGAVASPVRLYDFIAPEASIAGNGTSYVVVTRSSRDLFAQEVSDQLAPLSERHAVHTFTAPDSAVTPRVIARGGEYLLTYAQNFNVLLARRLTARGAPAGAPAAYSVSSNQWGMADVALSGSGGGAFVWIEHLGVRAGLFDAQSIASERPLRAMLQLSVAAQAQSSPQVVAAGNSFVVGWLARIGSTRQLRLTTPGRREPVIVGTINNFSFQLLHDGTSLWIVWLEGATLNVRRYTHALVPIDAQPWRFPAYAQVFAAGDRGIIGVGETGNVEREIVATTIRAEGDALIATQTDVTIGSDGLADRDPAVTWNGREYVIAWVHQLGVPFWQFPEPVPEEIHVLRVTREGGRLDAAPIVIEKRGPTFLSALHVVPAVGGGTLVVWTDPQKTYAAIFRGEPMPEVKTLGSFALRGILPLPNGYLFLHAGPFHSHAVTMHVQRMTADLVPDGAPLTITGQPDAEIFGISAATVASTLVVAYVRNTTEAEYTGVQRVFVRHGQLPQGRRRVVR